MRFTQCGGCFATFLLLFRWISFIGERNLKSQSPIIDVDQYSAIFPLQLRTIAFMQIYVLILWDCGAIVRGNPYNLFVFLQSLTKFHS